MTEDGAVILLHYTGPVKRTVTFVLDQAVSAAYGWTDWGDGLPGAVILE